MTSSVTAEQRGDRPDGAPDSIRRAARVAGLHAFQTPTLETVERRRLQLWLLTIALLLALTGALTLLLVGAVQTPVWLTSRVLQVALLLLVGLFSAYAIEKELTLRRLTGLLVEERVLTAALTNRVRELSAFLEAGRALNLDMDLRQVLSSILTAAVDLLGARNASVMLLRSGRELRTVATAGDSMATGARIPVGEGIAGRVAQTREPLLISGRLPANGRRPSNGPPLESAMCAPLVHRHRVLGVVNVNAPPDRSYTEHDLRALNVFAEPAATAIALAQLLDSERLTATQGAFRALHDPLTNLPNRALFLDRLRHAMTQRRTAGRRLAVVFTDLNGFKEINDTYGHSAGDRILVGVADRLRHLTRAGDTVARFGGDEFILLLETVESVEEARQICSRLLAALAQPYRLGEIKVSLSARAGLAVEEPGMQSLEALLRNADTALQAAQGSGDVVVYDDLSGQPPQLRFDLHSDVERALREGELTIHYQPILRLEDRKIVATEALLRWNHPERGLLSADAFIDEADRSGLLPTIDLWTLEQACRLMSGLRWERHRDLAIHVNLLPTRLQSRETVDRITAVLDDTGLPPQRLVLEITENHLLPDVQVAGQCLTALRDAGARIALDDFGSGYSSLRYLQSFPVTMVKIDRTFVQGIAATGPATPLVEAILRFAQGLGLDVVAEGVETASQLERLLELGCHLGQGFLLCRPLPASELISLLTRDADRSDRAPAPDQSPPGGQGRVG